MPRHPIHLLLVEDNIDQKELTLRSFRKKLSEARITAVENGPASLQKLGEECYDAVILDYSLPLLNGLEVLKQIQERGYTVPVVMVTGQGDEKLAVEAMKGGPTTILSKPKTTMKPFRWWSKRSSRDISSNGTWKRRLRGRTGSMKCLCRSRPSGR